MITAKLLISAFIIWAYLSFITCVLWHDIKATEQRHTWVSRVVFDFATLEWLSM